MTDVSQTRSAHSEAKRAQSRNPFTRLGVFTSQVLDELRKVVRPTRSELWNYTLVVIVFVTIMMAIVSVLDFGFGELVNLVFGKSG